MTIWMMILASWELAYRVSQWNPQVFPAPSHVVDTLLQLTGVRTAFGAPVGRGWPMITASAKDASKQTTTLPPRPLLHALMVSIGRLAIGYTLSVALGFLMGLLLSRLAELDRMLGPLLLGLQALPSVCWVPLALLLPGLGATEKGIIFVTVMGSTFAIAISLRDGLRTIPEVYQRAGMMMGARGWELYRYVLIPSSLPALTAGLRLGFSFSWRSLMGAEVLFAAVAPGLGFLLRAGSADVRQVITILIVMVVIGMIADRWIFARLQHRIAMRFGLSSSGG